MELTKPSGLVSQSVRPYVRMSPPGVDTYHSGVDTGVDPQTGCRHHHSVGVETSVNTNNSLSEIGVNTSVNTGVDTWCGCRHCAGTGRGGRTYGHTDGLTDQPTRLQEFHMLYGTKKHIELSCLFDIFHWENVKTRDQIFSHSVLYKSFGIKLK